MPNFSNNCSIIERKYKQKEKKHHHLFTKDIVRNGRLYEVLGLKNNNKDPWLIAFDLKIRKHKIFACWCNRFDLQAIT